MGGIRRQPIVRMANLDDELCLSFDGDLSVDINSSLSDDFETLQHNHLRQSSSGLIGSCTSLVDSLITGDAALRSDTGTSFLHSLELKSYCEMSRNFLEIIF